MGPGFRVRELRLRLRRTFTTSRGTGRHVRNILLHAYGEDEAWGEGAPRPQLGTSVPDCVAALERWIERRGSRIDPEAEPEAALSTFQGPPPARAALDTLLHDRWARSRGVSGAEAVERLYGLRPGPLPLSSFTIDIGTESRVISKVRAARGYPILKVKLGNDRPLRTIDAIRAVSDAELRVDVNGAWTADETRARATRLAAAGVSLLEQPLPEEDLEGYRALAGTLPIPVIADESCRTVGDVERLAGAVDGINIKLSKAGGLREAARMIRAARDHGMRVMVGCFGESSLAITAAATLAPYVDFVDLDAAAFLARDPFDGARIREGLLVMPPGPGLGVRPARRWWRLPRPR